MPCGAHKKKEYPKMGKTRGMVRSRKAKEAKK